MLWSIEAEMRKYVLNLELELFSRWSKDKRN